MSNVVEAPSPEMPSLSGKTMLRGAPSVDSTRCMPGLSAACLLTSSWISAMGVSDCLTTQRCAEPSLTPPSINTVERMVAAVHLQKTGATSATNRMCFASFQCCSPAYIGYASSCVSPIPSYTELRTTIRCHTWQGSHQ
jgi:hypothetical protein